MNAYHINKMIKEIMRVKLPQPLISQPQLPVTRFRAFVVNICLLQKAISSLKEKDVEMGLT